MSTIECDMRPAMPIRTRATATHSSFLDISMQCAHVDHADKACIRILRDIQGM